jgi:hypothetical protein
MALDEDASAASWTVSDDRMARWHAGFNGMFAEVAGRFPQASSRWRARWYLLGLLSGVKRKNSWTLAEQAGDLSPDGMQRLLNFYCWGAEEVRDDLRGYVLDRLGDPAGVAVADETGFLKKGECSAGVQRQYSGTAGRVENCQLGVFLTYVTPRGRALFDRELYLPRSWISDRDRCRAAGIDDDVEFATKPELARRMLSRLCEVGPMPGWFTAAEAYGDNPGLRDWLDANELGYVMAISREQRFDTPSGRRRADELAARAPATGGNASRPAPGPRASASTTGSCWPPTGTLTGCWCAARSPIRTSWPTTSSALGPRCRSQNLSGSLAPAGAWRKPSSSPRTKPASTTTRSADMKPGTGT